jgi:hypothetical protein
VSDPIPYDCPRCGHTHPGGCRGHRSGAPDQPCLNRPIKGGSVCASHGGRSPQVRAAADRRLAEREALLALETFGLPRAVSPQDALLEEVHRTAGAVEWLGAVVAGLERDEVTWGMTRVKDGGDDRGTTHEAGVNVWVKLWNEQRAHLVKVCSAAIAAGIEERRVRLAESQGQLLASVVSAILGDLQLTDQQQELVQTVVPRHLRAVAALEAGPAAAGGAA